MGFCGSAVCVLILLRYLHHAVVEEAPDEKTVRVYLNDSALLPCSSVSCIGTVSWVKLQNSSSVVAHCNMSSCSSTEGYQMSHSDYLKGNFSLNITAVSPSITGSYSCGCENTSIQEVVLHIKSTFTVKVKFNGTAVLPCSMYCPGLAKWTTQTDILAECNQTSCRSVKEGYQMIYNQYLQGNLFLIITEADFSKRGWYTCDCDDTDLCLVRLQIEPLKTQVQIKPGESLLLNLDVSDPVEVMYSETGAANQTSRLICTVDKRSQVKSPYTLRTSLTLELRGVNESDSGVYTIRDTENKEDIHIYNVTVQDHHSHGDKGVWVPTWRFWSILVVCIFLSVVMFVFAAVNVRMCKNNKCLGEEKLELPCLKCGASEEGSLDTEQDPLTSTNDLDNRDSPPTANSFRSENTSRNFI